MSESIPPLDPGVLGPLREAEPAPAAVRARARRRLLSAGGEGPVGDGGATNLAFSTARFVGFAACSGNKSNGLLGGCGVTSDRN